MRIWFDFQKSVYILGFLQESLFFKLVKEKLLKVGVFAVIHNCYEFLKEFGPFGGSIFKTIVYHAERSEDFAWFLRNERS